MWGDIAHGKPVDSGRLVLFGLLALGLTSPGVAQAESFRTLKLQLEAASPAVSEYCETSGTVTLSPAAEEGVSYRLSISLGGPSTAELPASVSTWSLSLDMSGCWAPESVIEVPNADEQTVAVWPAGEIVGMVAVPLSQEVPASLTLRLTPAPSDTRDPRPAQTVLTCPITDGRFSCPVPAEHLDLRIAAADFVPEYLWDVSVLPGTKKDVGEITLVQGASLAGWVVTEKTPKSPPTIEITQEVVGSRGSPLGERLEARAIQASASERGFFQIRGLALGSYRIVAQAESLGSATLAPILIDEPREYVLDEPLVLEPKASLALSIDPPLSPDLTPWTIRLERELPLSSMFELIQEGALDDDGLWTGSDLDPGHYLLRIRDDNGSTHFKEEIDLTSGRRTLAVELAVVRVRGTLRAGDLPLSRRLWFQRLDGPRIRMQSDEDGQFEGVLPQDGRWTVRLEPLHERGQQFLEQEVAVVRARGDTWAELEIVLPDTALRGEVLDSERDEVAGALVSVYRETRMMVQVFSQEDGSFEVLGLPEGAYRLRAEAQKDRESQLQAVNLDGEEPRTVELVVVKRRTLQGHVVYEDQPVAGAVIRYQVPSSPLEGAAHSNPEGRFLLPIPGWVDELDVVVLAPGFPTKLSRITVPPTDTLAPLHVAPTGGVLVLRIPRGRQPLYIKAAGAFVPIWSLFLPSVGGQLRGFDPQTSTLQLPLEPGSYTICPAPHQSRLCESGFLSPNGLLQLDLQRFHLTEDQGGEKP